MTRQEFEHLTGIHVTHNMYDIIEKHYMECEEDKQTFCKKYKENVDGLAEKIQFEADNQDRDQSDKIHELTQTIDILKLQIEKMENWKPYEEKRNVKQSEYEALKNEGLTNMMTDNEAINLINYVFGFPKNEIMILHRVKRYEINYLGQLRRIGDYERHPLYMSSDWNYIRFDCFFVSYEFHNGELRMFED